MNEMQVIILLWVVVTTIIWIIIGWRAMRAHESISYTFARYVASQEVDKSAEFRAEAGQYNRDYRQFINEDPSRANLPPKERHDAFRIWSEERGS